MESVKILLVEDEPKVASFVKQGLDDSGYSVDIAYDGFAGKTMALANVYQLVILDLNIPHINGIQLCKLIREVKPTIPVLMLTAFGSIEDKVKGFEAGADDYLLKPFEVKELDLRIKALLKRSMATSVPAYTLKVADLELNMDKRVVTRSGTVIPLRAKEYLLLEFFMHNAGKVLTRLEISSNVWGINFDTGTNVIDVYVNFLRKKIDANYSPKLIHTCVGYGYMFSETID